MKRTMYYLSMAAIVAMAAAGCTKYVPSGRNGGNDQGEENTTRPGGQQGGDGVAIQECTNWSIRYLGRADYQENDGSISRVEEFSFNYPGNAYFLVRTITDQDFKDWYDGQLEDFFTGEVSDVVTLAQNNGTSFTDYLFSKETKTVYFDLILHGEYTTYMIEVSQEGKITGNYAKTRHTVQEETAVEGYLRWIGEWHVSDGYVGYDIVVSAAENNYLYYVDGWETGSAVQEQMTYDRDWIFARYRNQDGNLYFYGQYLTSYEDEDLGTYVDQMFVGTYLTESSDKNGIVDEEGADFNYDIAHTSVSADGRVSVEPESFTFENGFRATYHSMRYSRYCYDEGNWAHYNNSGVPSLPLTLEAQPGSKAVQTPARRIGSKQALRRVQLRSHVPKQARSGKAE